MTMASLRRRVVARYCRSYHVSGHTRGYRDSALVWAEANPEVAQKCLQPPPFPSKSAKMKKLSQWNSLEDYQEYREWVFNDANPDHARAIVSHVLSAPLSIARYLAPKANKLACIGARAEASLPLEYWREFLWIMQEQHGPCQLSIDFSGPECLVRPSTTVTLEESSLQLSWPFRGYYHGWKSRPEYDGYMLLNPGIGHRHLASNWEPTLRAILSDEKPVLLTAHSKRDATNDAKTLRERYGINFSSYESNPFASRITYQDPFDETHLVQPNHSYLLILR